MGIGPYALRGDEGRHAGVVVPYGGFINHPGQSSHSGALAPVGARDGRESEQRSSPKYPATPGNPSVTAKP